MAETHSKHNAGIATRTGERAAGSVLVVGSLGMLIGGLLHPPGASSLSLVSESLTRWLVSHWVVAGGVFLVGLGSFLVVVARSELAATQVTLTAWSGVALGSLPMVVFMIGEATVLPALAAGGTAAEFATWRAFIEMGAIASLFPVTIGLILIAWTQARAASSRTPAWVAWGGVLVFAIGLVWIIGFGFLGIASLGPLFLVELLGFIWLGWLGLDLARSDETPEHARAAVSQTPE